MRVTLLLYMVVISVSLNFPYPARVTLGERERVGPAPKCPGSAFTEGPGRSLSGALRRGFQTCFGRFRDPAGAAYRGPRNAFSAWWGEEPKQNDAVPQGAGEAPKRDPEQRTGYETEGTHMRRDHRQDSGDASPSQLQP